MSKVYVSVCVNDHRNGVFSGELDGVKLFDKNDDYIDIMAFEGLKCQFNHKNKIFIVEKQQFPYHYYKEWYGNWCWNLLTMDLTTAKKLLRLLKDRWGPDSPDEYTDLGYEIWNSICMGDRPGQTKIICKIPQNTNPKKPQF